MKVLEEEPRVTLIDGTWSASQAARDIIARGGDFGEQDEAFYVCDLRELAARHARWRDLMPRVEPFYAVKCNDDKLLLRTLAGLGMGFDCATRGEIELVTSLGVASERIIYAHTVKMPSHVRYAASVGVTMVTFDSEAELIKIKQHMPHAQVVLRIRCDAKMSMQALGEKFGCDPVAEAPALLKLAAVLGLDLIGVSFHVGVGAQEYDAYARGIAHCRDVFALAAEMGHVRMRLVDIGGGFPGASDTSIEEISAVINAALETHFPDRGVRVIAEPGQYFAAAAYTLAVMVHGKREVPDKAGTGETHTMYYINAGVYNAFDMVRMGAPIKLVLLNPSTEEPKPCSLWGPSCCSLDRIDPSTFLPPLQVGSWLLFRNMGAYTMTISTKFNGFAELPVLHFADHNLWLMLKERSHFSLGRALPQALPCAADAGRDRGELHAVFVECALK